MMEKNYKVKTVNYLVYKNAHYSVYFAIFGGTQSALGFPVSYPLIAGLIAIFAPLAVALPGVDPAAIARNRRNLVDLWANLVDLWWTFEGKVHHEKRPILNLKSSIWWTLVDLFTNPRIIRARLRARAHEEGTNPKRSTMVHHLNLNPSPIWWTFGCRRAQSTAQEAR